MKKYRPGVTSGLILGVTALVASLAGQSFDRSLSHSVGPVPSGRASAVGPATVATTGDTAEEAHARQVYASLPPSFEANRGQTDQEVRFLSRGRGYTLFLTPSEAVLVLKSREAEDVRHERSETNSGAESSALNAQHSALARVAVLRMRLVNANRGPIVEGLDELPGKSHYFIGNNP